MLRPVCLAALLASAPLVLLSWLPSFVGRLFVPYAWSLPWFVGNFVSYLYLLLDHHAVDKAALMRRAVACYLLVLLSGAACLVGGSLIEARVRGQPPALLEVTLGVGLLLGMVPLHRALYQLVGWVGHAGRPVRAALVARVGDALALAASRDALHSILLDELPKAMGLVESILYLRDDEGLQRVGGAGGGASEGLPPRLADGSLSGYLARAAPPVVGASIRKALDGKALSVDEQALLDGLPPHRYWLPLVAEERLEGLLMVAARAGEEPFGLTEDGALATLARQAAIAAHRVRRSELARGGQRDWVVAHQELLTDREQERRRLARELHDGALQQLIGVGYQLQLVKSRQEGAGWQPTEPLLRELETIRHGVVEVVKSLRGTIRELRPPDLEMGLGAALTDYVASLQRFPWPNMPRIELRLLDSYPPLSEELLVCLLRVAQEALRNALKHANATVIEVVLSHQGEKVELTVRDDGDGFLLPAQLSDLAHSNHYGLLGIMERTILVGGQWLLESSPGTGTEVRIWVPVSGNPRTWNSLGE